MPRSARLPRSRLVSMLLVAVAAVGVAATAFWLSVGDAADYAAQRAGLLSVCLAGVAALTTANLLLRWLRWHFLVRRCGIRVHTRDSIRLYFATLPAIATPFSAGELVRAALLSGRFPRATRYVSLVWGAERLTDATVLLLLYLVARGQLGLALTAALLWAAVPWAVHALFRDEASREIGRPPVLAAVFAGSLAAWTLPAAGLWGTLQVLAPGVSPRTAAEAVSFGTLVGGLAGIPLGTGVTGSAAIITLEGHGLAPEVATAATAVFRAGTAWYAVGLGALALLRYRRRLVTLVRPAFALDHFDEIACGYEAQIPAHIRERLLHRKVAVMRRRLEEAGVGRGARGLDVGCGQGWYATEMAAAGYDMVGFDRSADQIGRARAHATARGVPVRFDRLAADRLPYAGASFDFAYGVNVLHHIPAADAQRDAIQEVLRVLKPGGVFFLHEINTRNPLFRVYMGYIFPLLCEIDEGTERWIRPGELPEVAGGRWTEPIDYFTFLPDFTPPAALRLLRGLEARLERSRWRRWSAHYVARLIKEEPAACAAGVPD